MASVIEEQDIHSSLGEMELDSGFDSGFGDSNLDQEQEINGCNVEWMEHNHTNAGT
jgi:hypothetical protein